MSIFDVDTTTEDESPDNGHEEESAEETENEQDQENESTEQDDNAEDESPDPGQDELLAGKFKTQADLVKAYQNAQKKITELAMQSKQPPTQQPGQQQPLANDSNVEDVFWESFQKNPLGTMQYLIDNAVNQRTAPIFAREEQQVLASNMDPIAKQFKQVRTEEGMTQLFDRVSEIAQEMGNPRLADNPSPRILKMAAQELFGDGKAALVKNATEAGRIAAEEARRNKQAVTVTTSSKRAPQDAPKSEADKVKESIRNAGRSSGIFGL